MATIEMHGSDVVIKSYVLTAVYDPTIHNPEDLSESSVYFRNLYGYPLSFPRNPYNMDSGDQVWIQNEDQLRGWCAVWFDTWHIREVAMSVPWTDVVDFVQRETIR